MAKAKHFAFVENQKNLIVCQENWLISKKKKKRMATAKLFAFDANQKKAN